MKKISIIFSFRNEERNIPELVKRTSKVFEKLQNWKYELIFVNDDSTDKSEQILLDLQKSHPIKLINMSRNFGIDPCVLAGLEKAKGEAVIYMDSDLQDDPLEIPKLYNMIINDGYDLVSGWKKKRLDPLSKTIPTKLYNWATRIMSGRRRY